MARLSVEEFLPPYRRVGSGLATGAAVTVTAEPGSFPDDSTATRLASAGYDAPTTLIWGGGAALLLGLAAATAGAVKRRRASAN